MDYTDALKHPSFGLDKNFCVVTSKSDIISFTGVIYKRSYKITLYQKVLFFFGIDLKEKIQLLYTYTLFIKETLNFKDTYTPIAL